MRLKAIRWRAWWALLALLAMALTARALVPLTAPSLPERVVGADRIVVGKVTKIEEDAVEASPVVKVPGVATKVRYRIAVVAVESPLLGAEGVQSVRVAFVPPTDSGGKLGRGAARYARVELKAGQGGCWFLHKHPDESFHVAQAAYDIIDRAKEKDFEKQVALVKRCVRLLNDTKSGLQSKEADDRLLTAALLIYRYRTPRHVYRGQPKTEPIDAEKSKQILAALAEADWTGKESAAKPTPLRLFLRLDLTAQDGWKPPAVLSEVAPAARQWLHDHADSYRIRRYVPPDEHGN
jgi:hypothetical protein